MVHKNVYTDEYVYTSSSPLINKNIDAHTSYTYITYIHTHMCIHTHNYTSLSESESEG